MKLLLVCQQRLDFKARVGKTLFPSLLQAWSRSQVSCLSWPFQEISFIVQLSCPLGSQFLSAVFRASLRMRRKEREPETMVPLYPDFASGAHCFCCIQVIRIEPWVSSPGNVNDGELNWDMRLRILWSHMQRTAPTWHSIPSPILSSKFIYG